MWGEAVDRARRLLRQQQAQVRDSDSACRRFWRPLQATPNGVVLLDSRRAHRVVQPDCGGAVSASTPSAM
jgi:hypothetical protein